MKRMPDLKRVIIAAVFICLCSFAPEALTLTGSPCWGVGVNYGFVNNLKMFNHAGSDSGQSLQVDYFYRPNDSYFAVLEFAFVADANALKNADSAVYVETASYLNLKHCFSAFKKDAFSSYLSVGTGLYGVNLWQKLNKSFTFQAANFFADISLGAGCDFKAGKVILNADLSFPALLHVLYGNSRIASIFSFGCKYYF